MENTSSLAYSYIVLDMHGYFLVEQSILGDPEKDSLASQHGSSKARFGPMESLLANSQAVRVISRPNIRHNLLKRIPWLLLNRVMGSSLR